MEAYHLLSAGLGLSAEELHEVFAEWNKGELDSYLIEITSEIFTKKDEDGAPMVDKILDAAGQKEHRQMDGRQLARTGRAGDVDRRGCLRPLPFGDEGRARRRVGILTGPNLPAAQDRQQFIEDVRRALYCSRSRLVRARLYADARGGERAGWDLNYGGIALMWRGGCIIRSRFLGKIKEAFDKNPQLTNLLLDDFFSRLLNEYQASWRRAVIRAIEYGVPTPAFSTALSFFDGYRAERLPANLLQAQRDFFGAHTYERVDRPRGEFSIRTGQAAAVASRPGRITFSPHSPFAILHSPFSGRNRSAPPSARLEIANGECIARRAAPIKGSIHMKPSPTLLTLIFALFVSPAFAQTNQPQESYPPHPDSQEQPGVPKGEVLKFTFENSKIFPGTWREYWVYVPAQYHGQARLRIRQSGRRSVERARRFRNLIHKKEMPVTIGVFVMHGRSEPRTPNPGRPLQPQLRVRRSRRQLRAIPAR